MKRIIGATLAVSVLSGCATGLNSIQKREYEAFKQNDVLVEEKNPTTGAVLGILPGGGSFYAQEPALGVVNLLFWPLSILWDPISGHEGAKAINYDITTQQLRRKKEAEISELDNKLTLGQLENSQYVVEKRKVEQKYNYQ